MEQKYVFRVRPGFTFGTGRKYRAGDKVILSRSLALPFADRLEEIEEAPQAQHNVEGIQVGREGGDITFIQPNYVGPVDNITDNTAVTPGPGAAIPPGASPIPQTKPPTVADALNQDKIDHGFEAQARATDNSNLLDAGTPADFVTVQLDGVTYQVARRFLHGAPVPAQPTAETIVQVDETTAEQMERDGDFEPAKTKLADAYSPAVAAALSKAGYADAEAVAAAQDADLLKIDGINQKTLAYIRNQKTKAR